MSNKIILSKNGNVVKVFAETFEPEAAEQIRQLVEFEAYKDSTIRIMPDAHAGKGCTVGTTMTLSDKITPNLVGVDIGCGMLVVQLPKNLPSLEHIDSMINEFVPSGFNVHANPKGFFDLSELLCKDKIDMSRSLPSIGTLGGGNHFIEIAVGREDTNYLVIHSGSRKLGNDVCRYYQGLAGTSDLDFLDGELAKAYLHDMKIVQGYATHNRFVMSTIILERASTQEAPLYSCGSFSSIHNYIDFDRMILRKGAVSAEEGEMLLIPINMRDGSLLCVGKGNADWNYSAPHGAGRLMSRSKAKKQIAMQDFSESMSSVYSTSVCPATLDEAPQAYKSMEEIVNAIEDTVSVIDVLKPIYNFKAH